MLIVGLNWLAEVRVDGDRLFVEGRKLCALGVVELEVSAERLVKQEGFEILLLARIRCHA